MGDRVAEYRALIDQYLSGISTVDQFQRAYFERVKGEERVDERLFMVLDKLFGDLDAYTSDIELLKGRPDFYIDEAELRKRVIAAAKALSLLRTAAAAANKSLK